MLYVLVVDYIVVGLVAHPLQLHQNLCTLTARVSVFMLTKLLVCRNQQVSRQVVSASAATKHRALSSRPKWPVL
jgi:hypothetical protein